MKTNQAERIASLESSLAAANERAERAERELASARKDTARLDGMITGEWYVIQTTDTEGNPLFIVFAGDEAGAAIAEGSTARAAIDAALAPKEPHAN